MLTKSSKKFIQSLAVFTGTVIGVGVFGLPYVAAKVGFLPVFLFFLILTPLLIIIHSFLGEIACGTKKIARVPGYAEIYLGKRAKKISLVISSLGLVGAQLAYLIVGGQFLYSLVSPVLGGSYWMYVLIFFGLGSALIYFGIKSIANIELVLLVIFFLILMLFVGFASSNINLENFITFDAKYLFLPYGVIMFALYGSSVIPEIKEMLGGNRRKVLSVIVLGSIIIVLAYLIFIVAVLGVSGASTTEEALRGFVEVVGNRVIVLGFVFGLIATFTSFLTLGLTFKKIMMYDCKLKPKLSWAIASFIPLGLFILGFDNFISIIGLSGAIAVGGEAIIIVLIYRAYLRKRRKKLSRNYYSLIVLLILGIITQVITFLIIK